MLAVSSRPLSHRAYPGAFHHVGRTPLRLVDAMLADWFTPYGAAQAATPEGTATGNAGAAAAPQVITTLKARVELFETATGYELRAELPGVHKHDIEIDVDGTQVMLRARVHPGGERQPGDKLLYSERGHQAYERSLELPQAVDPARATAQVEDGVLTLELPRLEPARSTRISIG
ncbi:MAG: hypothetical protein RLZZ584_2525 [Pseudomonadota bacterium]